MMYKLFIVEDEEIIRNGLVNSVQWSQWGFEVCGQAANGKKALEAILEQEVDVVLADVRMPVMDGMELARLVKEAKPSVRIVILSGFAEFKYAQQSLVHGVYQYILKPVKLDQLGEVFSKLKTDLDKYRKEITEQENLLNRWKENEHLYEDKLLTDLIYGRLANDHMEYERNDPQLNIRGDVLVCIVIGIDNMPLYEPEDLKMSAFNSSRFRGDIIAQAASEVHGLSDIRHVKDEAKRSVLVIGLPFTLAEAVIVQFCERILFLLKTVVEENSAHLSGITFSAGAGSMVKNLAAGRESYEQAAAALEYRFYTGPNSVNRHSEIPGLRAINRAEVQQIKQQEKKLIAHLMLGEDPDQVIDDTFADFLHDRTIEYNHVRKAATQMMDGAIEYFLEHSKEMKPELKHGASLDELSDLSQIIAYLKDEIARMKLTMTAGHPQEGRNVVHKVKEFITANYMHDIVLTDIAERHFMNPSYLSWLFKQETGMTFTAYLTNVRMEAAKELLKEDIYKVYEVAQAVGYNDYRIFTKTFKKMVGFSPKEYKQKGK